MKCPVCKDTNLTMTERQSVEIDYCPQCRGVWLDRGELDKVVERAESSLSNRPHTDRAQRFEHRDYDDDYRRGKHKSFLRALFD